jgi:hypothetical protein
VATELVNLLLVVNLDFQGSPLRFTTLKTRFEKGLWRRGEPGEPSSNPIHVCARTRTHARMQAGVDTRFTRFIRHCNTKYNKDLAVVNLVSIEVHQLPIKGINA